VKREALLLKTLGHPARLAILGLLRGGEQCVCHLEHRLGMRQAYISQQLAVLKEAGIIRDRRDGWNIFYFVPHPEVFAVMDAAREVPPVRGGKPAPNQPVRSAARDQPGVCPCPKCRHENGRKD
jgi:DNA-binding transcriptional ArsR family regulator